jgi:hypothetical protein
MHGQDARVTGADPPFKFSVERVEVICIESGCLVSLRTVRGKEKWVEGVRGRREKKLGALWFFSRLPCIAFELCILYFKTSAKRPFIF